MAATEPVLISNPLRSPGRSHLRAVLPPASVGPAVAPAPPSLARRLSGRVLTAVQEAFGDSTTALDSAEEEHAARHNFFVSSRTLVVAYGRGVSIYYLYALFLIATHVLLAGLAAIPFGVGYESILDKSGIPAAFTGLYPDTPLVQRLWIGTTTALYVVSFLAAMCWHALYRRMSSKWKGSERVELTIVDHDLERFQDVRNLRMTAVERRRRRVLSIAAFVLLIGVQIVLVYYVQLGMSQSSDALIGFVLSVTLSVLAMVEKQACKYLTRLEAHATVSETRNWDCAKVFALKLTGVFVLYIVKSFFSTDAADGGVSGGGGGGGTSGGGGQPPINAGGTPDAVLQKLTCAPNTPPDQCTCPLVAMSWQFFWLLVVDVIFNTVVGNVQRWLLYRYNKSRALRNGLSDQELLTEFDTADEYVKLWYRHFLVLLGAPVFPLLTAMGAVAFGIEYVSDRWKLLHLCRKPLLKEEPLSLKLVTTCFIVATLASLASYPNSFAFVLARALPSTSQCRFLSL